jgi:alpha-L-fucosidase
MYSVGIEGDWGSDTLHIFTSCDLENWECSGEIHLPGWRIFNTCVCKMNGVYTLLMEIDAPAEEAGVPFTFRFATSKDMLHWELTPKECVFQKDRYAGGPSIYALDDGYYYVLYLEAYPGPSYSNCIARSCDLINWEYSPINPVMMYNEYEDKKIANPFLTVEEQKQIDEALDINNSDMELCEFNGRTIIYYSWGNQQGMEFLAETSFEGSMKEFLQGWFPTKHKENT